MNHFSIPYGHTQLEVSLPEALHVDWILPANPPGVELPEVRINESLDQPLECRLEDFKGARSAVITINDKTRPVPYTALLPPLLERLEKLGIPPAKISLLIATGTHQPATTEEYALTLPPGILARYPVISHDCDDPICLMDVGNTTRGTPVQINRAFMDADLRIVTGNIEPHHFMGYSGGVKSAAIGLAGRETITTNHAMLPHPLAITGHFEDNPMRQDVEEIGRMIDVHFAFNAVLNLEKEIVDVFAGRPEKVMQAGIKLLRRICQAPVLSSYDMVIASAGGHPKDINFYQAEKALTHATMITRPGGIIILAAACPEGTGSPGYEAFMQGIHSPAQVLQRFNQVGFQIGPHKAFQVARILQQAQVVLVSEMDPELVRQLLLVPAPGVDSIVQPILARLGPSARIALLPYAVNTVPMPVE